ncbi:hypothetical protein NKG05_04915 [Oerskovia sp. M15]
MSEQASPPWLLGRRPSPRMIGFLLLFLLAAGCAAARCVAARPRLPARRARRAARAG